MSAMSVEKRIIVISKLTKDDFTEINKAGANRDCNLNFNGHRDSCEIQTAQNSPQANLLNTSPQELFARFARLVLNYVDIPYCANIEKQF
jgi:hypothetical protein